jgi:hypothetical protein
LCAHKIIDRRLRSLELALLCEQSHDVPACESLASQLVHQIAVGLQARATWFRASAVQNVLKSTFHQYSNAQTEAGQKLDKTGTEVGQMLHKSWTATTRSALSKPKPALGWCLFSNNALEGERKRLPLQIAILVHGWRALAS